MRFPVFFVNNSHASRHGTGLFHRVPCIHTTQFLEDATSATLSNGMWTPATRNRILTSSCSSCPRGLHGTTRSPSSRRSSPGQCATCGTRPLCPNGQGSLTRLSLSPRQCKLHPVPGRRESPMQSPRSGRFEKRQEGGSNRFWRQHKGF